MCRDGTALVVYGARGAQLRLRRARRKLCARAWGINGDPVHAHNENEIRAAGYRKSTGEHGSDMEAMVMEVPIMKYFEYKHLPDKLKEVSKPFCELAQWLVETIPNTAERATALRKLLEGKDAAVRAAL